jgi:type I restriction enzyme S subunit
MGTGGVASVHLGKGRYAYSTDTWAIRIKESSKLTQPYVYRVLELSLPKIDYAGFEGSGLRHLRKSYIKDFRFLAPSDSASQRRIVSILSGIDTAIEKTEALIAKYQQIKAGLMHDLFTRGVLPNGQLRSPDQSVQTAFGKIPAEWRLGSILELTDTQRQPILTGPFGADLGNADFVAEGVPVLRIGNVQQGRLDLEDLLYVTPRKATTLSRYRIKEGDLLFARQGATTGRNALADERVEGCLINYHIIRVALDQERCAPLFVEAAFTNEVIKRQIERDKGRGTREGINTAQLTSLAFPIAPVAEQRLIAAILSNHNRLLKATEAELHSLRMEKLGLMQDLLTGKVPVKVGAGGMANG